MSTSTNWRRNRSRSWGSISRRTTRCRACHHGTYGSGGPRSGSAAASDHHSVAERPAIFPRRARGHEEARSRRRPRRQLVSSATRKIAVSARGDRDRDPNLPIRDTSACISPGMHLTFRPQLCNDSGTDRHRCASFAAQSVRVWNTPLRAYLGVLESYPKVEGKTARAPRTQALHKERQLL